jgi:4-hydroxybenzoate polyprenyltransferase/phosphoserine phosphatase
MQTIQEVTPERKRSQRVVVIDMDHTLLLHDTLHEQLARILFQPKRIPGLLAALTAGKAAFKAYCTDHIDLNFDALRTCPEVLSFIEAERANGSLIVLCTAANMRLASAIAERIGLFDEVIGTESGQNLKGVAKASLLSARFPQGFIYAGDHFSDLPVWAQSEGIVLVGTDARTTQQAEALGKPIVQRLRTESRPSAVIAWFRALRVHHWAKNFLLFAPIILAHKWFDFSLLWQVFLGFLLLLATTSAGYVINDLADLDADRQHATKCYRPIASGALPITHAIGFAILAIPTALILAFALNPLFSLELLAYLILTLAYSFRFKSVPLLDVFVIGLLFTLRIVMGATFIDVSLPLWLLTFSIFFFFSLAMAKRHTEIVRAKKVGGDSLQHRGYQVDDWPLTLTIGVGAALGSLIILVLYMVEEAFRVVGYSRPAFLWMITLFLAVWVGRIWLLTHRGQMNDDPVVFALRDRTSQAIAVMIAVCFLIAI